MSTADHEILLRLGNRWVVFAPPDGLPVARTFGHKDGDPHQPRVGDDGERDVASLIASIKVADGTVHADEKTGADFAVHHADGSRTYVELKRAHAPTAATYDLLVRQLADIAQQTGAKAEAWLLDPERVALVIFEADADGRAVAETRMRVADVWEYSEEGVFDRERVVARVQDWANRIHALYASIASWTSARSDLEISTERHVLMAESMMHEFAVPDRELPILDVIRSSETIISFVPRGLWVIGADGRIDVITRVGTELLVDIGLPATPYGRLVSKGRPRAERTFDSTVFESLVASS